MNRKEKKASLAESGTAERSKKSQEKEERTDLASTKFPWRGAQEGAVRKKKIHWERVGKNTKKGVLNWI